MPLTQATGRIVSSYRDQQPVLLADKLVHQEEDYQCFDLDTAKPRLQKLKKILIEDICYDLSCHVTSIYHRWDLHLVVLLALCYPLWINFPGEGRIRGWPTSIMVGDSGTGKTSISQGLLAELLAGHQVKVTNLGTFRTHTRAARTYNAPLTDKPVKKPATTTVKFKVTADLKRACNE